MIREITKDVQIMPVLSCISADAATDRTSEVIDTRGYSRVTILYHAGPQASSAVTAISLKHADAASNETTLTSGADVEGTAQSIGATDDGKVYSWEFIPGKRFYQIVVNKDGANNTNESAIALLYNADECPVTHAAGGTGAGTGTGAVATPVRLGLAVSGTI